MKWCGRINNAVTDLSLTSTHISSHLRELAFREARDCFCAAVSDPVVRKQMGHLIGRTWEISKDRVDYYWHHHSPSNQLANTVFRIGRVSLPRVQVKARNESSNAPNNVPFRKK